MKSYFLIQPKPLVRKLYPKALWKMSTEERTIYLTFDDGPVPGLTEWVLDELKKYEAKATFFCVGANIIRHPGVYQRILGEGHRAANHTMHHVKGFRKTVSEYMSDVDDCEKLTGNGLFRPPYGQLRRSQYNALLKKGYKVVFWDVISYDYENISEEKCLMNVLQNTTNGSIVLFHDNIKAEKNLRSVLPLFLKHFANLHYNFKAL